MRALPSLTSPVLFLTISAILMTCCCDQLGYYSDEPYDDKTSGDASESIDLNKWEPQRRIKRKRDDYELLSFETTPSSSVLEYYVDDAEEIRPYNSTRPTEPSTTSSYTLPEETSEPALSNPSLSLIEEQLRKLRLLASNKDTSDERDEGSDENTEDYSFY